MDVPVEIQVERTLSRDGVSEEQVKSIIKSQISREKRLDLADLVITNDGSLEELQITVRDLHQDLMSEI